MISVETLRNTKKNPLKLTQILLKVIITINILGYILPQFSSFIDCSLIIDEGLGAD